jgi:RHS repeat-associated protein
MRIAMRTQVNGGEETLNWLIGDPLSSTSMTADADGVVLSEVKYSAFGEIRDQSGATSTDYLYTGQRQEAELGLYYYVARWYDPAIGRFIQADTIIPDPASAKAYDRFAYVMNNPLRYTDPTGHYCSPTGHCTTDDDSPGFRETWCYQDYSDWEFNYGRWIAASAFDIFNSRDQYYTWGYADGENMYAPPPAYPNRDRSWETGEGTVESLFETLDGRTPVICADIPILTYHANGIELYGGNWDDLYSDYDNNMIDRSVEFLGAQADVATVKKTWNDGVEVGDIVKAGNMHVGVIVYIGWTGDDPNRIYVIETSESDGVTMVSLAEFSNRMQPYLPDDNYTTFEYLQFHP